MIESIKMVGTPIHQFNYLSEESQNKQVRNFVEKLYNGIQFAPGLNYIVGENGSGKSTLLNIIKSANRCKTSFIPKPNRLKITTIKEMNELFAAFEIKQDYKIPVFNLYRQKEDDEANKNLETKDDYRIFMASKIESKGQNLMGDINELFNWMFNRQSNCLPLLRLALNIHKTGDFLKESNTLLSENETSSKLLENINKNQVDCTIPTYTVLMDEPDQGLDISNLKSVYETISYDKPQTQLIAVIHNPFLIYKLQKTTKANWIELTDGYINSVKKEIKEFERFIKE